MIFDCCNADRKKAVLANTTLALNGIDYLEVLGPEALAAGGVPLQTLMVHCLRAVPTTLTTDNIVIEGGESITHIGVQAVKPAADPQVLMIITSAVGDFSSYQLKLVASAQNSMTDAFDLTGVLPGFDAQLAAVPFSFHAGVGPGFDCAIAPGDCAVPQPAPPAIDYLAKDFGSFRTLILDRLNQLLPAGVGGNEADLAVVLAELIAYRADQLSYQQDAVATEAYLTTARSRVSLRRHARLVGYPVHDGCNARAWVHLTVAANPGEPVFMDRGSTYFYTAAPGMPSSLAGNEAAAIAAGVQIFQPMQDAVLYAEHNQISFYTWGDTQCCLPAGAVEATLRGDNPNLQAGDVLIFQEMMGPQTGNAADADLRHRCVVRLTQVAHRDDAGQPLVDALFGTPITQIRWSPSDALPFALCVSSSYMDDTGVHALPDVSVALGNVVLADHGVWLSDVDLGVVPNARIFYPSAPQSDHCTTPSRAPAPIRFRPLIPDSPLTQAAPLPITGSPASTNVQLLGSAGAAFNDANGFTAVQFQATNLSAWPPSFGVLTAQNADNHANFDLSVIYSPAGTAAGAAILEKFTNLSLDPSDPGFALTRINSNSVLLRVPATYKPPSKMPAGFPEEPTMLVGGAAVTLQDTSSPARNYLSLQPTPPQGWAAKIGVQIQALATVPPTFDVEVLYCPTTMIGVTPPVMMEQFTQVPQGTFAETIHARSQLVTVQNFMGAPNVALTASELAATDPKAAIPAITLQGAFEGTETSWNPLADLLASGSADPVFVVEIESNGIASVRFATPEDPNSPLESNGLVPPSGTSFRAGYRIGNGSAGNVGAESLKVLATADARIQACINPLPAGGGTDPESNEQIRRRAPQDFMSQAPATLARSITMADYEAVAGDNPQINQATSSLRWTGSWYTAFIAAEPKGGGNLSPALQRAVTNTVQARRLAGQDVHLESPQYISLQLTLSIEVDDYYFRSDVERSLRQALGNQVLPNGQKGFFYPDNFTFGRSVYLSPIYAAARAVAGVKTVTALQFQPQDVNTHQYLEAGQIPLGSLQIARLDNDPSFPGHGQLSLILAGGR